MLKNILAVVGLVTVARAAYTHYCEYSVLKREKAERDAETA